MSKNNGFLYIFLCITLLCVFCIGVYFNSRDDATASFTIKEYNGKLCIFTDSDTVPISILDTNFDSLPAPDKDKLKNGITVFSEEELYRLIEDFSG